ncbi:MAG: hypothetical protein WA744_23650, partial [Candidatus Acidiferrales bacterium]
FKELTQIPLVYRYKFPFSIRQVRFGADKATTVAFCSDARREFAPYREGIDAVLSEKDSNSAGSGIFAMRLHTLRRAL